MISAMLFPYIPACHGWHQKNVHIIRAQIGLCTTLQRFSLIGQIDVVGMVLPPDNPHELLIKPPFHDHPSREMIMWYHFAEFKIPIYPNYSYITSSVCPYLIQKKGGGTGPKCSRWYSSCAENHLPISVHPMPRADAKLRTGSFNWWIPAGRITNCCGSKTSCTTLDLWMVDTF